MRDDFQHKYNSPWASIIQVGKEIEEAGVLFLKSFAKIVYSGEDTKLWNDFKWETRLFVTDFSAFSPLRLTKTVWWLINFPSLVVAAATPGPGNGDTLYAVGKLVSMKVSPCYCMTFA